MVCHITFMFALFHDKKCCNFFNLFLCILCDLILMGLVLSGEDLIKTVEGHMRSTCWKLKSQCVSLLISRVGQVAKWPARCTDSWDFKCDSYTIYPYYIYPHYPQDCKETIQKKILERGFYNAHHFRESYSSSRENSFVVFSHFSLSLLYLERRFVPKHNPHLFRV